MIAITKEDALIISRIADGSLWLWEAGLTMSPTLIAILAVFCCIVGFVMGRVKAAKSKPEFTGDCDLLQRMEYKARMQGDMAALVYGSKPEHRRSNNDNPNR